MDKKHLIEFLNNVWETYLRIAQIRNDIFNNLEKLYKEWTKNDLSEQKLDEI